MTNVVYQAKGMIRQLVYVPILHAWGGGIPGPQKLRFRQAAGICPSLNDVLTPKSPTHNKYGFTA